MFKVCPFFAVLMDIINIHVAFEGTMQPVLSDQVQQNSSQVYNADGALVV